MATQTPSVRGIPADDTTPQTLHFGDIPIRTFRRNGVTWFMARMCAQLWESPATSWPSASSLKTTAAPSALPASPAACPGAKPWQLSMRTACRR